MGIKVAFLGTETAAAKSEPPVTIPNAAVRTDGGSRVVFVVAAATASSAGRCASAPRATIASKFSPASRRASASCSTRRRPSKTAPASW